MDDDVDDLGAKVLCHGCVGDPYLAAEIQGKGCSRICSYCGMRGRSYTVEEVAGRVEQVFAEHYRRTSDQPHDWQWAAMADKESDYEWDRDGEPVVHAIMNSADMPEKAAEDIQAILEARHDDFDAAAMGEETEFSSESHYEEKGTSDHAWREEWANFEHALRTEARFFSQIAVAHLRSVFDQLISLRTRDGRPLVVTAGPGQAIDALHRARVFQSVEVLKGALCHPDIHLGPPPARLAAAGRMNARGISVFYGATEAGVAVAEVRPPVGSRVAVARFEIVRPLRLLDLTALAEVRDQGSVYDPTLSKRLERAMFLRSLAQRMTQPVMPDDEAFDYLPTQAVADYLATEGIDPLDGIMFASAQSSEGKPNVVLFHKAAIVEKLLIPAGTLVEAQSEQDYEDGPETEYVVFEELPNKEVESPAPDGTTPLSTLAEAGAKLGETPWNRLGIPSLRVDVASVTVHHIQGVSYDTSAFKVRRQRWGRRELDF